MGLSSELATPAEAAQFFAAQLRFRTDAADLAADLLSGVERVVVVDTRSLAAYQAAHIPGAIHFPHREMNAATTANLDRDTTYVTYCDGIGCNGSTRGAYQLSALGFCARELIGGIAWWQRDGYAIASGDAPGVLSGSATTCAC